MAGSPQMVSLAPFQGVNGRRIADPALGATVMRGGFNVELRDSEWWTRKGEKNVETRVGGLPWWWIINVNSSLTIVANAFYALAYDRNLGFSALQGGGSAVTESVTFTNGSATATSTTTRTNDQLILAKPLVGSKTHAVYRVLSHSGTTITLDRVFEGTSGAGNCTFLDPLARDLTGTATGVTTTIDRVGSCFVFEQLVTHAAADIHAASPATTAGNSYLIITSNRGTPVAIDLTAYLAGSPVGVLRSWFFLTNLSSPTAIGQDTAADLTLKPRGIYGDIYRNRVFIGYATDPNNRYGDRTVYYSVFGDFLNWHTGIPGQTATPNFETFVGEGNSIAEMKVLGDDIVVHRWYSQEVGSITQSQATAFTWRSTPRNIGIHDQYQMTNRVVVANNRHYIWTRNGPAIFDGSNVTLIARRAYRDLIASEQLDGQGDVVCPIHDHRRRIIYWMLDTASTQRHQDATPAGSTYGTVFAYEYDTDEAWMEDHPIFNGGGFATGGDTNGSVVPQAYISRADGTILSLQGRTTAKDADVTAPETAGSAVTVNAQVDTPWLTFGSLMSKQLKRVRVVLRSLVTGQDWDLNNDLSSGTYGLRLRIFSDWVNLTAKFDQWAIYDSTNSQLTSFAENLEAPTFVLDFTPKIWGAAFKFRFSNTLTAAAISAGYRQAPFRIVDVMPEWIEKESDELLSVLNSGNGISELTT